MYRRNQRSKKKGKGTERTNVSEPIASAMKSKWRSYLAGRHIADGSVRLDRFQLVQTPIQLLQRLHGQSRVRFIFNKI